MDTAIALPARCDRAAVESLLPELRKAATAGCVEVDGRLASKISLPLLQLLLALRRSPAGANIVPSQALLDAARLAGLEAELFGADT